MQFTYASMNMATWKPRLIKYSQSSSFVLYICHLSIYVKRFLLITTGQKMRFTVCTIGDF